MSSDNFITNKADSKPIAIILPVRNSCPSMQMTLISILQNFRYPYRIFLIESESTDGTAQYCDALAKAHPDRIEVHHIPAGGTTKAYNYGMKVSGDMDVLLTQDDVIFHNFIGRDLLFEFAEASKMDKCGIASVWNGGGTSGPLYKDGFKWIGTWCMFIPRKTINKIGMLDENYNPGDGDDIDYSYAIEANGLRIYRTDLFVEHHRKLTIQGHEHESQKIKQKNSEYFKRKWSLDGKKE